MLRSRPATRLARGLFILALSAPSLWPYEFIGPKWPGANPVVSYRINERGSAEVLDEWEHVNRSFEVWDGVDGAAIETEYGGVTAVNALAKDGINLVKWAEGREWPLGSNVIAATFIWYQGDAIREFDLLFNDEHYSWSTTGEADKMDVAHIGVHEAGHALGLDHSEVSGASMWPTARTGDISYRDLHSDDSAGLAALYPRTDFNNRAPVFTSSPVSEAVAGMKYRYAVTAEDPDGDPVSFALEQYPLNMRIDNESGVITWFPKFLDVGSHTVTVSAVDHLGRASTQTFQVSVTNLRVYTADAELLLGDTLYYEVKVSPMDEFGIFSGNVELDYNKSQMTVLGVDTKGSVVADASFFKNITDSQVKVAFAGSGGFTGEGVLFRVKLVVNEQSCGEVVRMGIGKALFNDGDPVASRQDGDIFMSCRGGDGWTGGYTLDGRVSYFANGKGVPDVILDFPKVEEKAKTGEDGGYAFRQVPRLKMEFTIKASKDSGDVRGALSAYDASLVLRHVVGLHELQDYANQKLSADVNGNGAVTAYDAALILRHLVGLEDITRLGRWVLSPKERTFPGVLEDMHDIDFGAYLVGDVSGNWNDGPPPAAKRSADPAQQVLQSEYRQEESASALGTVRSYQSVITLAREMEGMYAGEFELAFDKERYRFLEARPLALMSGYLLESNAMDGNIRVVFAGTEPLPGSGELFEVLLVPVDWSQPPPAANSNLAYFKVNEGQFRSLGVRGSDGEAARRFGGFPRLRAQALPGGGLATEYSLETAGDARLQLLDVRGRVVAGLAKGRHAAGHHRLVWNRGSRGGTQTSAHIYFLRLTAGAESATVKILLGR